MTDFGLGLKATDRANKLGLLNKYINQLTDQLNSNAALRSKVETAYQNRNSDLIVALGQGGAFSATYQSILKDRHKLRTEYSKIISDLDKSDKQLNEANKLLQDKNSTDGIDSVDFNKVDNLVSGAISAAPTGKPNEKNDSSSSQQVSSVDNLVSGGVTKPETKPIRKQSPTRR